MKKQAIRERDQAVLKDYLAGMTTKQLCEKYKIKYLHDTFKRLGFSRLEYERKKFSVCRNHPDRESFKSGRCEECYREFMRTYADKYRREYYNKMNPNLLKAKQRQEPRRELTPNEKKIKESLAKKCEGGSIPGGFDVYFNVCPKHFLSF